MRNLIIITPFLLLLLSIGCSRGSGRQEATYRWDSKTGIYQLPEYGVEFHIPNPETSIVAPPQNLPNNILMCVIDTISNISVTILKIDTNVDNQADANAVVDSITTQNPNVNTVTLNESTYRKSHIGHDSWRFIKNLHITSNQDTFNVVYSGYLFDGFAVVATGDKIDKLDSYLNNLINI